MTEGLDHTSNYPLANFHDALYIPLIEFRPVGLAPRSNASATPIFQRHR